MSGFVVVDAEHADILILSNVRKNGQPIGLADAGTYFHTDYSYLDVPARATLLYSIQVPKVGGDTLFADQYSAYDELPGATKERIDGLVALHHYGNRDDVDRSSRTVASVLSEEQERKMAWVRHPVARRHPITGRKALYAVSGSSFGIDGMPQDEAIDLLDELKRHATQPKYQVRLKYGVGDMVIWDNASLLHSATLTDPDSAEFAGGGLTVRFAAGGTADDRLGFQDVGTGAGQVGVSGATVTYGGTPVGTFTGGTDGSTPLVLTSAYAANMVESVRTRPAHCSSSMARRLMGRMLFTGSACAKSLSCSPC